MEFQLLQTASSSSDVVVVVDISMNCTNWCDLLQIGKHVAVTFTCEQG